MRAAGFLGLDLVMDDLPEPHNTTSVLVSTVPAEVPMTSPSTVVHILHRGDGNGELVSSLVHRIAEELKSRGLITGENRVT